MHLYTLKVWPANVTHKEEVRKMYVESVRWSLFTSQALKFLLFLLFTISDVSLSNTNKGAHRNDTRPKQISYCRRQGTRYRGIAGTVVMATQSFVRQQVFIGIDHVLHVVWAQQARVKPAVCWTGKVTLRQEADQIRPSSLFDAFEKEKRLLGQYTAAPILDSGLFGTSFRTIFF